MGDKWIVMRCDQGNEWHLINACGLVDTKEEALAHVELEKEHDEHWNDKKMFGEASYMVAKVTEFEGAM